MWHNPIWHKRNSCILTQVTNKQHKWFSFSSISVYRTTLIQLLGSIYFLRAIIQPFLAKIAAVVELAPTYWNTICMPMVICQKYKLERAKNIFLHPVPFARPFAFVLVVPVVRSIAIWGDFDVLSYLSYSRFVLLIKSTKCIVC